MSVISVLLYMASIVAANLVTAKFHPISIGVLLVPAGTFFIGVSFLARNLVQGRYGKRKTYLAIAVATVISAASEWWLSGTAMIVVASAISFVLSESTDTEAYSRFRLTLPQRVLWSGSIAGVVDSAVFVIVGLSPVGVGYLTWAEVPYAILGQLLVKTAVQALGALAVYYAQPTKDTT